MRCLLSEMVEPQTDPSIAEQALRVRSSTNQNWLPCVVASEELHLEF
jgi:hypothetical protein